MTKDRRMMAENEELYAEVAEITARDDFKAVEKELTVQQIDFALLMAATSKTPAQCAIAAGYSKTNPDRAASRQLDNGFVRDAIQIFRNEIIIKRGVNVMEHRRWMLNGRDKLWSVGKHKEAITMQKLLLEVDGHTGSAKHQRSGNVQINISGLIPESIRVEQPPIEGAVIPEQDINT